MEAQKRLNPKCWHHDGYTLTLLVKGLRALLDRQAFPQAGTVLDFGAGHAPYRSLFESRGLRYVTADLPGAPSDVSIPIGEPLPLDDQSADVVVSFQVLEHVWELDWYLDEVRRLLAPGGQLILSTHGVWLYHPHPGDYRRWTRQGLVAELESRGYHVESVEGLVGPLAWTTQFRLLGVHQILSRLPLVGGLLTGINHVLAYGRMVLEDAITPKALIDDNAAVYLVVARPVAERVGAA